MVLPLAFQIEDEDRVQYQHDALVDARKQIRLLKIYPPTQNRSITLHLETFDHGSAPPYTALSYEWGTEENQLLVNVNAGYHSIRRNLYHFLEQYQTVGDLRTYFWIDQITIDQFNVEEKNHQVSQMGDIYSRAEHVLIWLGPHEHAHVAKAAISKAIDCFEQDPCTNEFEESEAQDHCPHSPFEADGLFTPQEKCEIKRFYELSYWRRHCILQEILLASSRSIMYGQEFMPFEYLGLHRQTNSTFKHHIFKPLLNFWLGHGVAIELHAYFLFQMSITHCGNGMDTEAWYLLMSLSVESRCYDVRDKIFGIQNLFPESLRLEVDYRRSPTQLFRRAAFLYVRKGLDDFGGLGMGMCYLAKGMGLLEIDLPKFKEMRTRLQSRLERYSYAYHGHSTDKDGSAVDYDALVMQIVNELLSGVSNTALTENLDRACSVVSRPSN